jgi:hypothetical protein
MDPSLEAVGGIDQRFWNMAIDEKVNDVTLDAGVGVCLENM